MERTADYSFEAERQKGYTPIRNVLNYCISIPIVVFYKIKDLAKRNIKPNKLEQKLNN